MAEHSSIADTSYCLRKELVFLSMFSMASAGESGHATVFAIEVSRLQLLQHPSFLRSISLLESPGHLHAVQQVALFIDRPYYNLFALRDGGVSQCTSDRSEFLGYTTRSTL